MSELSSNYSSCSGSDYTEHSCKFEKIAKDQQARLQIALAEIESKNQIISQLTQQLTQKNASSFTVDDEYIIEIKNLNEKCQILEAKNECLKDELNKARLAQQKSEKTIPNVETEYQRLLKIVEKQENQLNELKTTKTITKDYESLVSSKAKLEDELNSITKKNYAIEAQLSKANERIGQLESKLEKAQEKLCTFQNLPIKEINTFQDTIAEQNENIAQRDELIKNAAKECDLANEKIEELQNKIRSLMSKVAKYKPYKKHAKELTRKIDELENKMSNLSSNQFQSTQLQQTIKSQKETIDKLRSENNILHSRLDDEVITKMQGNLFDITIERDTLIRDMSRLEARASRVSSLEVSNAELQEKVNELFDRLKEAAQREASLTHNLDILLKEREEIERIKNDIDQLQEDCDEAERIKELTLEQNRFLRAQNSDLEKRVELMEKKSTLPHKISETTVRKVTKHSHTKHKHDKKEKKN